MSKVNHSLVTSELAPNDQLNSPSLHQKVNHYKEINYSLPQVKDHVELSNPCVLAEENKKKFGINMEPIMKLSHTKIIDLPLRYDYSKFIIKYYFCLHMFNKMAITLLVITAESFCLDF